MDAPDFYALPIFGAFEVAHLDLGVEHEAGASSLLLKCFEQLSSFRRNTMFGWQHLSQMKHNLYKFKFSLPIKVFYSKLKCYWDQSTAPTTLILKVT